jgi:Lactonase, 7-bladed beta-propeller
MIQADRSGRFVLHADLGLDQIFVRKFDEKKGLLTPNRPVPLLLQSARRQYRRLPDGSQNRRPRIHGPLRPRRQSFDHRFPRSSRGAFKFRALRISRHELDASDPVPPRRRINYETRLDRPSAVNLTAHATYKKSELSHFRVDSGDCRSTKKWREMMGLNERINTISL